MANTLAVLSVDLQANTAAFQGDMGKAARIAERELKNISDAAATAGKLVGGALIAGGTAFAVMAKQAIDAADEMNDMAQKLGMSTEQLSAYNYAAKMSGASTEAIATSVQKLNSNMADAARGQGSAKAALDALGISVTDANGALKTNDEVMREVADRFSQFPDGATKSAMAVDIFGKSGADLIPMLDEGAVGLARMQEEAAAMGLILSTETAKAAGEVNDNLDMMGNIISGQVASATADMLPTIKQLSADFLSSAQNSGVLTTAMGGLTGAFKIVVSGGYLLAGVFDYVGTALGELAASAAAFATGDFKGAARFFTDGTTAGDAFAGKLDSIKKIWEENTAAANAAAGASERALGVTPGYEDKGSAKPKPKPAKKDSQYSDDAIDKFINEAAAAAAKEAKAAQDAIDDVISEAASDAKAANAIFDVEKSKIEAIQNSLMTQRQIIDQDRIQKEQQVNQARLLEVIEEQQQKDMLLGIEKQHKEKLAALDAAELATKKANAAAAVSFAGGALNAIAARSATASKAAIAISKAQSLAQIALETPKAALSAASAVAGIPIVGPGLAIAAKAAMYALGAAQAAAVMSGGSTSSSGGGGNFSASTAGTAAATNAEPISAQQKQPTQTTVIKLPDDRMVTTRDLVAMLNEAVADGMQLGSVRFVTA